MDLCTLSPMLIGAESGPFDDPEFIFELKLDGERGLAFLGKGEVDLRNKRHLAMLPKFPELGELYRQVKKPCVLDGEFIVFRDGRPDFAEIQRRSILSNAFKVKLAASQVPVSFVAYDILWLDGEDLTHRPLMERKKLLAKTVKQNDRLAVSTYVEGQGAGLFELTKQQGLEGVVGKQRDSLYYPGKRTKDWVKIKNLLDDDFVVCGYIVKSESIVSIVLGQYGPGGEMVYKGHVTLGLSRGDFARIQALPEAPCPFDPLPKGNDQAVWVSPELACIVKYMEKTANGGLRQPVFKGLRDDKTAGECVDKG